MRSDDRSFLRPGLFVGGAAAAGSWLALTLSPRPLLYAVFTATVVVSCAFFLRARAGWLRPAASLLLAGSIGALAGLQAPRGHADPALSAACAANEPVHFLGHVAEPLNRHRAPPRWMSTVEQGRLSLVIDVDAVELNGVWRPANARVSLGTDDLPLAAKVDDEVEGSARFAELAAPANPGEPDRRPRLRRAGISYVGALQRGAIAVIAPSTSWARKAENFREQFTAFVRQRLGEGDRAALVAALAVGERGGVSVDLNGAFNASGLAHVLSISGLHLAVAVLALAWLLRRLFALSPLLTSWLAPRRLAAAVALPVTAVYIVLIGAPAPAVRAGLGTGLTLAAIALGRDADVLNTLGWSLAAVALLDPAALDQPSTQLSFLGVAGLVFFTPRLREWVPLAPPRMDSTGVRAWLGKGREALLLLVLGTTSATLATAPVTAFYFERASLVAGAANVVAWPASTLIVPSGALGALLFPFAPKAAGVLVGIAGFCARMLAWCATFFASWPAAQVHVPSPSLSAIAAYAVAIICLANIRRWPRRFALPGLGVGLVALGFLTWKPVRIPGKLEVTFLSVGQGDSTVIRFPHGATIVIDAGGVISQRYDPGERVVTPFLQSQGVRKIDLVVASHPHPDHIGGLPSLFRQFPVSEFWHNGDVHEGAPLDLLIKSAVAQGTRVESFLQGFPEHCAGLLPLRDALPQVAALSVGDPRCPPKPPHRELDGVQIDVLHPLNGPEKAAFPELGENDNSLVLRLTYGKTRILLPGDIQKEAESILLAKGVDLSADLVKAPHHGSRTSSTQPFIEAVKPRHVVFCVGLNNQFDFPADEVVQRYEDAHCSRYRTDLDGAVTFTTDGQNLTVERFLQP